MARSAPRRRPSGDVAIACRIAAKTRCSALLHSTCAYMLEKAAIGREIAAGIAPEAT